ncbi:aspartate:alanine exchanger family transporter [Corynebacterium sp.]|uniref:aspartate:alanine exchanger family transporter n=1 Tax=Corynebacterium sp. TaxID=1720 RepID=UPI0026E0F937|nr:aspartate:alanine exchanger family transporter [Corynebacterium sp.]MDO5512834.1 aspartate:alanine exchanger family transporter [Corynebacterium sp.]
MLDFLAAQPLVALIAILTVGLALGKIRVLGISLGAAAVLFVALGVSTANPDIQIPPLLYQLGLAMFVYAIGLSAGAAFFAEFRTRGWRLTLFMVVLLATLVGVSYAVIRLLGLSDLIGAGMFAGALTSTPGMAAIVDMVEGGALIDASRAGEPVIGYSLAYPGAVIGSILVAAIGARLLRVDHVADATKEGLIIAPLQWDGVVIGPGIEGTIAQLPTLADAEIIATRIVRGPLDHTLAAPTDRLHEGMVLLINGTREAIEKAQRTLGQPTQVGIEGTDLVYKRITVSNPRVVGRRIADLDTVSAGFQIARIRRGDAEEVPHPEDVLNYSDRVRVVTPPNRMAEVRAFLGDSERSLAAPDLLPFALGLLAGLLLGSIPLPLPGGSVLSLGFGGGPIVAGLILGALHRTGPVTWTMPYHAVNTLSTLGLSLFLAGVGTTAGVGFKEALTDPSSLTVMAAGLFITVASALICAVVGMVVLRLTWDESMGVAAGATTNPAIISYLNGQTGTELATRGYATVYPTAMIGKIVASQILLLLVL